MCFVGDYLLTAANDGFIYIWEDGKIIISEFILCKDKGKINKKYQSIQKYPILLHEFQI